jgi:hypothetical protein
MKSSRKTLHELSPHMLPKTPKRKTNDKIKGTEDTPGFIFDCSSSSAEFEENSF